MHMRCESGTYTCVSRCHDIDAPLAFLTQRGVTQVWVLQSWMSSWVMNGTWYTWMDTLSRPHYVATSMQYYLVQCPQTMSFCMVCGQSQHSISLEFRWTLHLCVCQPDWLLWQTRDWSSQFHSSLRWLDCHKFFIGISSWLGWQCNWFEHSLDGMAGWGVCVTISVTKGMSFGSVFEFWCNCRVPKTFKWFHGPNKRSPQPQKHHHSNNHAHALLYSKGHCHCWLVNHWGMRLFWKLFPHFLVFGLMEQTQRLHLLIAGSTNGANKPAFKSTDGINHVPLKYRVVCKRGALWIVHLEWMAVELTNLTLRDSRSSCGTLDTSSWQYSLLAGRENLCSPILSWNFSLPLQDSLIV